MRTSTALVIAGAVGVALYLVNRQVAPAIPTVARPPAGADPFGTASDRFTAGALQSVGVPKPLADSLSKYNAYHTLTSPTAQKVYQTTWGSVKQAGTTVKNVASTLTFGLL